MRKSSGKSPFQFLLVVAAVAALGGGGFYYYRSSAKAEAPEVASAKLARGDIIQAITATGQLDPLLTVDVGSQISGLIKKLYVDFNSIVKKGEKLAEIDPATYQQKLRQAEADLAATEATNRLQRLNTERTKTLYDQKLVTQQEYDQALAQLQQSEAQLLTRKAVLENAKVDLDRCTIYSPIDGMVMTKSTEEGKTVAASLNAPTLFVIANDLAKMQITAAVAEADIGSVREGQEVTFTVDAFPNRNFRGRVTQVRNSPKTTQNVVTYDTIIDVDNRDLRLRPGMTANVSIIVAKREGTLRLPNAALRLRVPDGFPVKRLAAATPPATTAPDPGTPAPAATPATPPAGGGERAADPSRGSRRESGGGGGGGGRMFGDLSPEQRAKMREIMQEIGFDFRNGPPTDEQRAQMRRLMIERGIIAAEPAPGEVVVTTRTIYRLPGGNPNAMPEEVTIKAGITDGSHTEVIEGLADGDLIVTRITMPGEATATSPGGPPGASNNPFSGRRRF